MSDVTVKIEVNQINRGLIADTERIVLCEKAQEVFDKFCEVRIVSRTQLWGGKINAALDRQNPRDLFDVNNLISELGFSTDIKDGFIFLLLCGKRPIHELLIPHPIDQMAIYESQFSGMTDNAFGYDKYESTRELLIKTINNALTEEDKKFLLAFSKGMPDWTKFDYSAYPAIIWKLLNIAALKERNPEKYREQIEALENLFLSAHA